MSDIFISYARPDKQQAALLADKLKQQGWSVWWDREIPPGSAFDETIEDALNSAKCVIVLWSQNSIASQWVKTEAAEGAARGVLVPVLIENTKIPLEFKRIEAADLSDWEGDNTHPEFNHLIQTIGNLLDGKAVPRVRPAYAITFKERLANWWKMALKVLGITLGIALVVLSVIAFDKFGVFEKLTATTHLDKSPAVASTLSDIDTKPIQVEKSIKPNPVLEPVKQMPENVLVTQAKSINLFAPENGGQLLAASSDDWTATIDGKEDFAQVSYGLGKEAVYGFKDEQAATFDTFTMLISETRDYNVKEFELLIGNDSPTGSFESIGKFQTQNVKLFKTPYQEFKFPAVTSKYLKIKLLSTIGGTNINTDHPGVHEFQLFGNLNK